MSNIQFKESHKVVLDTFLLDIPFVKPGKMYGHPAYYVGGKLFASLFMDGVCVKLPESRVKEVIDNKAILPFEPMGRKMREWILIIRDNSEEYLNDRLIFEESVEYVSSLTGLQIQKERNV